MGPNHQSRSVRGDAIAVGDRPDAAARMMAALQLLLFLFVSLPVFAVAPSAPGQPSRAIAKGDTMLVGVALEPITETNAVDLTQTYLSLMKYLGQAVGVNAQVLYSHELGPAFTNLRSNKYAVIVGPAHVMSAALEHGYEPVGAFGGEQRIAFVALKSSGIGTIEAAKGKRIGLPPPDSLAASTALAEFRRRGIQPKTYFTATRHFTHHESALYNLEVGAVDVAVVDATYAKVWVRSGKNAGRVIHESAALPFLGIAVDAHLPYEFRSKLRDALLKPDAEGRRSLALIGAQSILPVTRDEYRSTPMPEPATPEATPARAVLNAAR